MSLNVRAYSLQRTMQRQLDLFFSASATKDNGKWLSPKYKCYNFLFCSLSVLRFSVAGESIVHVWCEASTSAPQVQTSSYATEPYIPYTALSQS